MKKNILSIDYGTKQIGLAYCNNENIPLPLGNIDNDSDLRFTLMGIIAQRQSKIILVGYPKHEGMRIHIDKFIKTLLIMDGELEIIRIDENYSSVQAQAITWETGKHIAHDTLAAIEIMNRYFNSEIPKWTQEWTL